MTRITLRRLFITLGLALAVMGIGLAGNTQTAFAQSCCPSYTVVVAASVPAACFPLKVNVGWTNGLIGASTHPAAGSITVNAPVPPGCWQLPITGIAVNNVPVAPCGAPVNIGCGNVTVCYVVDESTGCVTIHIS